ncbi:hypothetical protein N8D56_08045 [Devosia sp. A8/3-2]|nr:hypothetical protein N8D56_08045 [Devosia sp. A8/3-2]
MVLTITAPDGSIQKKELTLGVRATSGPVTTSRLIPLPAGKTVSIEDSYF